MLGLGSDQLANCTSRSRARTSLRVYNPVMVRNIFSALAISAFLLLLAGAASAAPGTMRLDYFHTGDAKQELFSVDRIVIEPLPWPGDLNKSIDDTTLGKYFFEVRDEKSRSTSIDPKDMFIDRSRPAAPAALIPIQKMGDPATKVDLLLLGDGYTKAEAKKFEADARRLTAVLFSTSPFKEHRAEFNVWGLCPAANESGISRPSTGVYRDSLATYDAFGSERYVLSFDNRALRKVAQFAPYEFVEILANNRTYGGGGIFNLYSTVAVDNAFANYVFVHEFGHHFAGLADEYYTSAVSYAPATERVEPWEPNATALLDPAKLKWKDLVSPDTPIPTPWNKGQFEKYSLAIPKRRGENRKQKLPASGMEALFREELQHEQAMFRKEKYYGRVGAFEGSIYEAKGYYRPEVDCIMFTRTDHFCAVCRRAIERIVGLYARRS